MSDRSVFLSGFPSVLRRLGDFWENDGSHEMSSRASRIVFMAERRDAMIANFDSEVDIQTVKPTCDRIHLTYRSETMVFERMNCLCFTQDNGHERIFRIDKLVSHS
jgi:hypothetical protein